MKIKKENDGVKHGVRVIVEPSDLAKQGVGVEIQVKGFKGSPEELDENNTHIYIERWEGKTRIVVWNQAVEPTIFPLEPSDDEEEEEEEKVFKCPACKEWFELRHAVRYQVDGTSYCLDCTVEAGCGCRIPPEKMILHEGVSCCETCYDRIK